MPVARVSRSVCASLCLVASLTLARPAAAQQRPLVTEDPEPVGAGRILIETGVDFARGQQYPVSGLQGNLFKIGTYGLSIGISSIAEIQIDGGVYNTLKIKTRGPAPLASELTVVGDTTHDTEDVVIGTKVRIVPETGGHPSFAFRFATRLPNAGNESGLGTDTTDFQASILAAKTVQSVRAVGNIGVGILGDATNGSRQNDVLLYGISLARAVTQKAELVAELNGRASVRSGTAFPGTESRGILKIGGRFTQGPVRLDLGVFVGMNAIDPSVGATAGLTYVFNAFKVP